MSGLGSALVLGTALSQELGDGDRALRAPLPLSRRIAVAAVAGGSGTSAVAGSVASLLGSRRQGTVLGVDAGGGTRGLGWQVGVETVADADAHAGEVGATGGAEVRRNRLESDVHAERRRHARSATEARAGLPTTGSGLHVLTLRPGPGSPAAAREVRAATTSAWAADAGPVARFFDVVVTDWGVRPATADLVEVAATSHVLALVSRADRFASSTAAAVLPALLEQPDAPRVVLVLVDVSRTADRMAGRLAADLALPVCWIPYDAARAGARPQPSRAWRSRTLRAHVRLGVTLMTAARQDPTRLTATRRPASVPGSTPDPRSVPVDGPASVSASVSAWSLPAPSGDDESRDDGSGAGEPAVVARRGRTEDAS